MIPVYEPWLTRTEKRYAKQAIDSGWISSIGEFVDKFEEEARKYLDVRYAISTNTGTAACHTCLEALEIGMGDEVLIPSTTFIATANAVTYAGAKPVIVDVDPDTWNIDLKLAEEAITDRTVAIMPVHLFGVPCDYDIVNFSQKHELSLIEDAAEAFGSSYNGKPAGTWGEVAAFSFYGNKTITSGEGGLVTTGYKEIFDRAKLYKSQGQSEQYIHDIVGNNYRMTNVAAAIAYGQLQRINYILLAKSRVDSTYRANLKGDVTFQKIKSGYMSNRWVTAILLKSEDQKVKVIKALRDNEIDSRPIFYPITFNEPYKEHRRISDNDVDYDINRRGIILPSSPLLKNDTINRICEIIRKATK
jgi:perosamine synthetase